VELSALAELTVHPSTVDPAPQRPALIELQLANGRCLRFDPMLEAAALTRLIRVVEAA
jgi:transposase